MHAVQTNFNGGLDIVSDDTNISPTGYRWLRNARQRFGKITSVASPLEIVTPTGKKQGIITVGNVKVVFIAGKAYYQIFNTTIWIQIPNFLMSTTADQLFAVAVPASSLNYVRKLNIAGDITNGVLKTLDFRPLGSPACILVQDGVNQPWVITFDENTNAFNSRLAKTYAQWANTAVGQEYVPIGKHMLFLNQILFIVAVDGLSIYRSVSGQPLNFMVNILTSGDKLGTESAGGATTVSFAFDYDPITCIQEINIPNSFIYATRNTTRVITLDYSNTIFGEPLFFQSAIIATGVINQYSLAEILGDYAFVNYEGITSFNAVQQLKYSGRNSIFSYAVSSLFDGVKQSYTVTIPFDNYVLFNVDTIYGNIIAVYDTLVAQWVAFDILNIGIIKQFSLLDTQGDTQLLVMCADNKFYQLYKVGRTKLGGAMLTRAFTVGSNDQGAYGVDNLANEIKSERLELIFKSGSLASNVTVTEICDGSNTDSLTQPVELNTDADISPINLRTTQRYSENTKRNTFVFRNSLKGFKLSYLIQWTNDASLQKIRLFASETQVMVSKSQQSRSS